MGGDVTVVVPCTDASMADAVSGYDGVSKVIAVKSDVFAETIAADGQAHLTAQCQQGPFFSSQQLGAKT